MSFVSYLYKWKLSCGCGCGNGRLGEGLSLEYEEIGGGSGGTNERWIGEMWKVEGGRWKM